MREWDECKSFSCESGMEWKLEGKREMGGYEFSELHTDSPFARMKSKCHVQGSGTIFLCPVFVVIRETVKLDAHRLM